MRTYIPEDAPSAFEETSVTDENVGEHLSDNAGENLDNDVTLEKDDSDGEKASADEHSTVIVMDMEEVGLALSSFPHSRKINGELDHFTLMRICLIHDDKCERRKQEFINDGGVADGYNCYNKTCDIKTTWTANNATCQEVAKHIQKCEVGIFGLVRKMHRHWTTCFSERCLLCEPMIEFVEKLGIGPPYFTGEATF